MRFKIGLGIFGFIVFIVIGVVLSCSSTIPAGYIGAKYDRSVEKGNPLALDGFGGVLKTPVSGFQWFNPITQKITIYPVTTKTIMYSNDEVDDSPVKEAIPLRTKEGVLVPTDITLSLNFIPEKVPYVMARFSGQDFESLRAGFIKTKVKEVGSTVVGKYSVEGLYGQQLGEINKEYTEKLKPILEGFGIALDSVAIVNPRIPENIESRIQEKIKAMQDAAKAEADLARIEVENRQKIAVAEANAESKLAEAKAKADAILYEAQKQAEANEVLSKSITPNVLAIRKLEVEQKKYETLNPNIEFGLIPDDGNMFFGSNFGMPITKN